MEYRIANWIVDKLFLDLKNAGIDPPEHLRDALNIKLRRGRIDEVFKWVEEYYDLEVERKIRNEKS